MKVRTKLRQMTRITKDSIVTMGQEYTEYSKTRSMVHDECI